MSSGGAILSNFDIGNVLERNGIPLVYIGFKDKLIGTHLQVGSYVLNMADSDDGTGGTHWICFLVERINGIHHVVYFDPFGLDPPEIVKKYVSKIDDDIVYNNEQLQNENSSICGWYVIYFIYYMNKMKQQEQDIYKRFRLFLRLFSTRPEDNRTLLKEYLKPLS